MKGNCIKVSVVLLALMGEAAFAGSGLFFNVSATGTNLTIRTTVSGHTYPAAGIKLDSSRYSLAETNPGCAKMSSGFCLFPVSDTVPASINITGPSGTVSFTLCLNGEAPLTCQNYSLRVVGSDCGRFTNGFTGSWSTVADNPFGTGMGFSGYLPQGAPATLYLGDGNAFDSLTGGSYITLAPPPTSFQSYGSMAYSDGFLWAITSGNVIQYDPISNTWATPATGLVIKSQAQTTVDDEGNLWTWENASTLIKYNIASGTTTTYPLFTSIGGSEPRIAYDSCSGLLFLADYSSPGFYSYDPSTDTLTTLSSMPGSVDFQDGFCSDRSGHVFAVVNGDSMYQYTISTGQWDQLPAGGVIGNSNSSCGIGSDGYLYASDPETSATVYRIKLT